MREYRSTTSVGTTWQFPSGTVIKAKWLLIVRRTNGSGITGAPATVPVVQSTLGSFGRGEEKIVLLDPSNQQVDEFIFRTGSTLYSGDTPFQIRAFLTRSEAFVRKFINDNDRVDDWEIVKSPSLSIKAWEWAPLTSDTIPPAKVSNIPATDATNVAVDTPVKATFSEPLLAGTALQNVTIKDENNIPVRSVQASVSGIELTIAHAAFENNKTYEVTVPAEAVKDIAGNANANAIKWSFKTIADIDPPVPYSIIPAAGERNVAVDAVMKVFFSERVFAGPALQSITIKDANNNNNKFVHTYIYTNSFGSELSIQHLNFEYNKIYTVNVPAQAFKDAAGNANTRPIIWSFTVNDIVPPVNLSNNNRPANGETNVDVDVIVRAQFNEPVFVGPTFSNITIKDANNIPVEDVQVTISASLLTIAHAAFEHNKNYTVNIPAQAVTDGAGNANTSAVTWSFTTLPIDPTDTEPPFKVSTTPADGTYNVEENAFVSVSFSEVVFPGPAFQNVTILDENNNPVGSVESSRYGSQLKIAHAAFETNKTYTVNVPAQAVKDAAGNANGSAITWSFSTGLQQTAAPVANQLSFHNNVPEYAQVYGAYGAVEADPWGTTVRIYSNAAKDTVLGTITTINGSFWLTFNNLSSLQTVYVTATATGKTESPVTPLPVSVSDTELVAVSIEPAHGVGGVALDVPIKVTFNEPILAGFGIQDIYIYEHFNGILTYVGGIVNGNELLIPHPTLMNSGYPFYDVFVPANAVTDTAGNSLATPLIWTFSTEWIVW